MTETYYSFDLSNLINMCGVCLNTNQVRPMSKQEINWYQSVLNMVSDRSTEQALGICYICAHLLRKYVGFYKHCRNAQGFIKEITEQMPPTNSVNSIKLHNFIQTEAKICNIGVDITQCDITLELEQDVKSECDAMSDRDDDMPLVMLKSNTDGVKVKKKRKKKNAVSNKCAQRENGTEHPVAGDATGASETERCARRKDGFTSRMVQETDEYEVIKLTEEQVLAEMREREHSERYLRALFKCARCVLGFNFADVLAAHMEKHAPSRGSLQCSMCSQYCPSAVSLRGHIKSHTTRYKCKVCGVVRRGRQHLLEHFTLAHTSAHHRYSCRHCAFTTDRRTVMQRHARSHRAGGERLACDRCGRTFRTVESLRVHTARHDSTRRVSCADCGRGFLYPSLLARHTHTHTDHYCVECDKRFNSPDNLRLHFKKAKRHRDPASYTYACVSCGDRFPSASSLAAHASSAHHAPKPHACALCPRRLYSTKESLRAHVRRAHPTLENS